ncbi:hypothetical protein GHV42_15755 [Xanthomonas oryzae pv. oryzicola]|nr:hypothetical protein [Xanthomonas oryzae]QGH66875.1 hypothetical protein GHV42_15755 [Xanthomonas oryzae pv. oryzicola]
MHLRSERRRRLHGERIGVGLVAQQLQQQLQQQSQHQSPRPVGQWP